ncbi:MAG TPA: DNA-directed RNA polymerase subunit omega [Candidatus Polarisedimenticolia bacterium]|nr:DNA-directed RNA polymerase subunit omega [Candidatus Polarisedimenticolia bacterium]
MIETGMVGNKFEFIAIAAERCKQLQRGARPKIETLAQKPVTIAQQEVVAGVIAYSYGPFPQEYQPETEVAEVTTEAYPADQAGAESSEPAR